MAPHPPTAPWGKHLRWELLVMQETLEAVRTFKVPFFLSSENKSFFHLSLLFALAPTPNGQFCAVGGEGAFFVLKTYPSADAV